MKGTFIGVLLANQSIKKVKLELLSLRLNNGYGFFGKQLFLLSFVKRPYFWAK